MISLFPNKYEGLEGITQQTTPRKRSSSKIMVAASLLSALASPVYAQKNTQYSIPTIDIKVECDGKDDAIYNNLTGGKSRIAVEEGCTIEVTNPKNISPSGKGKDSLPIDTLIRDEKNSRYLINNNSINGKSRRVFPRKIKTTSAGMNEGTYNLYVAVEQNNRVLSSTPIGVYVVATQKPTSQTQTNIDTTPVHSQRESAPQNESTPKLKQAPQIATQPINARTQRENFLFISPSYIYGNRENTAANKQNQTTYNGGSLRFTFGSQNTLIDTTASFTKDNVTQRAIGNTTLANSTTGGNITLARKLLSNDSAAIIATGEAVIAKNSYAVNGNQTFAFTNGLPYSSSTALSAGLGFAIGKFNEAFLTADARFLWLTQKQGQQNNYGPDFVFDTVSQTGYVISAGMMVPLGESQQNFLLANFNMSNTSGLEGAVETKTKSANGLIHIRIPSPSKTFNMGLILGGSYGTYEQIANPYQHQKQFAAKIGIGIVNK